MMTSMMILLPVVMTRMTQAMRITSLVMGMDSILPPSANTAMTNEIDSSYSLVDLTHFGNESMIS
jgi:hypothetical protein